MISIFLYELTFFSLLLSLFVVFKYCIILLIKQTADELQTNLTGNIAARRLLLQFCLAILWGDVWWSSSCLFLERCFVLYIFILQAIFSFSVFLKFLFLPTAFCVMINTCITFALDLLLHSTVAINAPKLRNFWWTLFILSTL